MATKKNTEEPVKRVVVSPKGHQYLANPVDFNNLIARGYKPLDDPKAVEKAEKAEADAAAKVNADAEKAAKESAPSSKGTSGSNKS